MTTTKKTKTVRISRVTAKQKQAELEGVMDTWVALEIVHAMAQILYQQHGEMIAGTPYRTELALNTVSDFIVNNCDKNID